MRDALRHKSAQCRLFKIG
ncbi:hypothetical protein CU665_23155, partial [Pseudomonas syringae pv. actinidifoliorum]|nr:hypothetical protein [Pseudomonas syringae pv. actinidifoliorum]